MKRFLISSIVFPILILTAGACAPLQTATITPSETPTLVPTVPTSTQISTPIPTESPAPVSDVREAVGPNQELLISPKDMSITWKDDAGKEIRTDQFMVVPGAEAKILEACQMAMYATAKAAAFDKYQSYMTFAEFQAQIEANGGLMNGMFEYSKHSNPDNDLGVGMIKPIDQSVNLKHCTLTFHAPTDKGWPSRPETFKIGVIMGGMWIRFGRSNEGNIQISIGPVMNSDLGGFPFLNKKLSLPENTQAASKLLGIWVDNMQKIINLPDKSWSNIVLEGDLEPGDKRRITFNNNSTHANPIEMHSFNEEHPDASSEWLQVQK